MLTSSRRVFPKPNNKPHFYPFWWEGVNLKFDLPDVLPDKADVVVVGAGFAGLSAAITAKRAGYDVIVLDAGTPGKGASTRNGGICSGNIRVPHRQLASSYGQVFADEVYREGVIARRDLIEFCKSEKIDCDFLLTGRFTGAVSKRHYEFQAREVKRLKKIQGLNAYMVPRHEQHREVASDLFYGGMVRPDIGGYHPGKFFAGLMGLAQREGVRVFAQTPVLFFEHAASSNRSKIVKTSIGNIRATTIIVATNGYTGTERPFGSFLRKRLVPASSCIIVTEPFSHDEVKALMPGLRMYGNTSNLYTYFRHTSDQRILMGGRCLDKEHPGERSLMYLKASLTKIFPQLENIRVSHCWKGNVAFTRAMLPRIFEHDGIHYVAGFCGSGTVWARWLGIKVAEKAMGISNSPTVFDGLPPKHIPFYDGNPWFMPAVIRWYALCDKAEELTNKLV